MRRLLALTPPLSFSLSFLVVSVCRLCRLCRLSCCGSCVVRAVFVWVLGPLPLSFSKDRDLEVVVPPTDVGLMFLHRCVIWCGSAALLTRG